MSYVNYISHSRSKGIRQIFSPEEDAYLCSLVNQYGNNCWKLIAKKMPNRTTRQCRERYKNYLSPEIKNGPWTKEEDELLKQKYNEYGPKWAQISSFFHSRSDVNIKNRWASITAKKPSISDSDCISPIKEPQNTNNTQQSFLQNNSNKVSNQRNLYINSTNSFHLNMESSSPISPNNVNNISSGRLRDNDNVNIIIDNYIDKISRMTKKDQLGLNDETRIQNKNEKDRNNFYVQSPIQPTSHTFNNSIQQEPHINNNSKHPILNLKKHDDFLPPLTSKKHDADNNAFDASHPLFLETLLLADSSKNDDSTIPPSANGLVKTFPNYGGNVW